MSHLVQHAVTAWGSGEVLQEFRSGGIRSSYFGWSQGHLAKYPLARFDRGLTCGQSLNHRVGRGARLADVSCVLVHYQFTASIQWRSALAAKKKNYGHSSRKYVHFLEILEQNPADNLYREIASPLRYTGTQELLGNGYIHASEAYQKFLQSLSLGTGCAGDPN